MQTPDFCVENQGIACAHTIAQEQRAIRKHRLELDNQFTNQGPFNLVVRLTGLVHGR